MEKEPHKALRPNLVFYVDSLDASGGGVARAVCILSEQLVMRGYGCYAVVLSEESPLPSFFHGAHYTHGRENDFPGEISEYCLRTGGRFFINTFGSSYGNLPLLRHVHREGKMAIISWFHTSPDYIERLSGFSRPLPLPRPIINRAYSVYRSVFLRCRFRRKIREVYSLSDAMVVLSPVYTGEFIHYFGIEDASRLTAIPNPCPVEGKRIVNSKNNGMAVREALYIGRLSYEKRVDRILSAWQLFLQSNPGWRLTIVGDGPELESLHTLSRRLCPSGIIFAGSCNNPGIYYRKSSLILLTSDFEGLPMAVIEAMGYGVVPVVLDSFRGASDIISDGYDGILVPFGTESSRKKTLREEKAIIRRFAEGIKRAAAIRMRASRRAVISAARYEPEKTADRWQWLFAKLEK